MPACYDRGALDDLFAALTSSRRLATTRASIVRFQLCGSPLRCLHPVTIRRLLSRFLPRKLKSGEPRIYGSADHPIRRGQLSRGALEVTRKLHEAGFKAFVVGGAVRDLLLGIEPKDFDVATDARPEQVKPLFRRAFIIGAPCHLQRRPPRLRAKPSSPSASSIGRMRSTIT